MKTTENEIRHLEKIVRMFDQVEKKYRDEKDWSRHLSRRLYDYVRKNKSDPELVKVVRDITSIIHKRVRFNANHKKGGQIG